MTIQGAIAELMNLLDADDIPIYYKGGIQKVIETIQMDMSVECKHGEWIVYEGGWKDLDYYPPKCECNQCGYEEDLYILNAKPTNYCPNCGADMGRKRG